MQPLTPLTPSCARSIIKDARTAQPDHESESDGDAVAEDPDEDATQAQNDEDDSPVYDASMPGTRPPGSGPVALGRGNARV